MPGTDGYGQNVRRPLLTDGPNIETATQTMVDDLVPLTVMKFANANARAAALDGDNAPTPGMVTYLIAEDRWDGRQADGTWVPLTPGPWKPLPLATGIVAHSGSPGYRFVNGTVQLRGRLKRSSNGQFTTGTDWVLATLPTDARGPTYSYWITPVEIGAGIYYGRTTMNVDNGRLILETPPGATSTSDGLHWTGLDGLSYSL